MGQRFTIVCLLCLLYLTVRGQYAPDTLGRDYLSRTIRMADDYEGEVVCTLIKKSALPGVKQALLYVHGYNDYFFQHALGDSIQAYGYNFYAVDLRKYGRSLLPHQDAFFCKDLDEYFADVDTVLSIVRQEGNERIILMGHSTGGLISTLYLDSRKGSPGLEGLILNSPFLDMNMHPVVESVGVPVIAFVGRLFPRLKVQGTGGDTYSQSLLADAKGEWEFNKEWKKANGHPKRAGWIKAIHDGHQRVQKRVHLDYPILLLSSDRSTKEGKGWYPDAQFSDIVLDVRDIQRYGLRLSDTVTSYMIREGMHDLILSQPKARKETYLAIRSWLTLNGK